MEYTVFDIETNGFTLGNTKIHCLSFQKYKDTSLLESGTIVDYKEMSEFIMTQEVLVGHYIILFDIPVLEKVLEIKIDCKLYDTIGISWYLYPIPRFLHGLEAWGERLGHEKPEVDEEEWLGITEEEENILLMYNNSTKEDYENERDSQEQSIYESILEKKNTHAELMKLDVKLMLKLTQGCSTIKYLTV